MKLQEGGVVGGEDERDVPGNVAVVDFFLEGQAGAELHGSDHAGKAVLKDLGRDLHAREIDTRQGQRRDKAPIEGEQ